MKHHSIIAVNGCTHSMLDQLYHDIVLFESTNELKVDLFLSCGDFQSVRNKFDMHCLACPPKFRKMGDFYHYFEQKKTAPVTTVFIGGNHEASNYLLDLYYGGWVAPHIYFLGYSGVLEWRGLTIAGVSGIHKRYDYHKGYYESYPFSGDDLRSVYHYRAYEFEKLKCFSEFRRAQGGRNVDIFLSHEWPTCAAKHGDVKSLLKYKPYFQENIEQDELGAAPLNGLVETVRPSYWFSGHLHCHYTAQLPTKSGDIVNFTALDKPIPKRKYLDFFLCWYDETSHFHMTPWDKASKEQIALAKQAQKIPPEKEESKEVPSSTLFSYNSDFLATLGEFQTNLSDTISPKVKVYPYPKQSSILARKKDIELKNVEVPGWTPDFQFQCFEKEEYRVHPFSQRVIELAGTDERFFAPMLERHQKVESVKEENPEEMYLQF